MTTVSSFEVLSQSLIPNGGANIPYVVQAYFVQVSYPSGVEVNPVTFDLLFEETTNFKQGMGQPGVMAQFIDENGNVVAYTDFFNGSIGFKGQLIAPGQTKIYSITVAPPSGAQAAMPQSGRGWRGTARLKPSTSGLLIATPSQRQIYFTGDLQTITDSVSTFVPTASGGTLV